MSHYDALTDEQRIKMAKDAVRFRVPIAPRIALWLQENGLYEQITNPRINNASKESTSPDTASAAGTGESIPEPSA